MTCLSGCGAGGKNGPMTDTRTPLEQALDLLVYAPVGLAVAARDLVPTLVERGRRQVDPQVGVARMVGQLAVAQGRSQAEKAVERAMSQARVTLQQLGILPDEPASTTPPGPGTDPSPAPMVPVAPAGPVAPMGGPPAPATVEVAPGLPGDVDSAAVTLAIPDYDSLSASQVMPRLSSLSPEELEAVRFYEEEHRGRKTILNKVAQIRAT